MNKEIKKEVYIEGLNCSSCAGKIGKEIGTVDGVISSKMDLDQQKLTIKMGQDKDITDIIEKINEIIIKHEHEIFIKEKVLSKAEKKVLIMVGLSCVNCANKIEREIKKIDGVTSAEVDFVTGKLLLEVEDKDKLQTIIKKASKAASSIESGTKFIEQDKQKREINKAGIYRISLITLIMAILLIFNIQKDIKLVGYIFCYLVAGYDVIIRALKNLIKGKLFDENFLMSVATIGAFAIKEYPEAVAVMLFYQIGTFLQNSAVNKSRNSINSLLNIRPDHVNMIIDGEIVIKKPFQVSIGDIIVVKPGERVPLDGIVIFGESFLNTSALSGESIPREVTIGSDVLSGSININGLIKIKVMKRYEESTVVKILELVQNASRNKAPTENFITKFASVYTPIVVSIAVLLAVIPPLLFSDLLFSEWINRALVFLVISCPCALVLSIPLSFFSGIGAASRQGILIKGGNFLEALNNVEIAVFDKTGTLTKGVLEVSEVYPSDERDDILKYAAYAESYSNHPIALSIIREYGKKIDKNKIQFYDEIFGYGIKTKVDNIDILSGNTKLMRKENIAVPQLEENDTIVHIAVNREYIGRIVLTDALKKDADITIKKLRDTGVKKLVMLTGDNRSIGEKISNVIGMDEVYSELLPHQKVEILENLNREKTTKGNLLVIGDGINDAPVLARADIGVAMGGNGLGSDAAIDAADVVIMGDEPSKLVKMIRIARKTRSIVFQNIWIALSAKMIVLLLGAFGIATMWEAVFADVGVTLITVFNSLRVLKSRNVS